MKVKILRDLSRHLIPKEKDHQKAKDLGKMNRFSKKYFIRKKNALTAFTKLSQGKFEKNFKSKFE